MTTPVPVELMLGHRRRRSRALGQVIQAMAKEAGFAVKRAARPSSSRALDQGDAGQFDTFQVGWSGRVDPDGDIYDFVTTGGSQQLRGLRDAELDALLDQARRDQRRGRAQGALHAGRAQRSAEERPLIYLYHDQYSPARARRSPACRYYARRAAAVQDRRPAPDRRLRRRMCSFVLRRAGAAVIVLFLSSILVFIGVRALPGDPALALAGESRDPAALRGDPREVRARQARAGPVRHWLGQRVHGDLGESTQERAAGRWTHRRPPAGDARARVAEPAGRARARDPRGDRRGGAAAAACSTTAGSALRRWSGCRSRTSGSG